MAHSTLNAGGMDTGSNYHFGDKMLRPSFPRSLFDLSHLSTMTIKNAGFVFPISLWRTVPSDEFDISVRSLIRVLPQKVPLYSRQRLYIYAFYSRNGDLWENWNTFVSKGLAGTTVKTIPTLTASNSGISAPVACDSISDYLGFPIGATASTMLSGKFSALPMMMYARIWRDYFFNRNFAVASNASGDLSNGMEYLLPDNDDHFRLNDDGEIISFKEHGVTTLFDLNDVGSLPYLDANNKFHFGLFPHLYPDDYFTSALPFQQRGDARALQLGLVASAETTVNSTATSTFTGTKSAFELASANYQRLVEGVSNVSPPSNNNTYYATVSLGITGVTGSDSRFSLFNNSGGSSYSGQSGNSWSASTVTPSSWAPYSSDVDFFNNSFNAWLANSISKIDSTPAGTVSTTVSSPASTTVTLSNTAPITLNALRELTISQLEMERLARTDGSYAEFGETFFGVRPKNAVDYRPVYIGGSYTSLSFTEVLQTSASSESSFLGQYAGHGIGADNQGYLGHVYCDDYGYIMVLGCIMPDVYYHQGVDKHYTELNQSQMLLPDRAKLGMQPILNQELYLQAYTAVDSDGNPINENLFAYQDIFDDYRFMNNRIHGQIADSSKLSFFPYTQSRHFNSLPNWSYEFAAATDVRKDYLAATIEDAYTAQFDVNVRAVRPLPSQSIPLTFGV